MRRNIFLLLLITTPLCVVGQKLNYPETKTVSQTDVYHGVTVNDPYRWLEDDHSVETKNWVENQNKVTFAYLATLPERDKNKARLTKIWNFPRQSSPSFKNGNYYYYKNNGTQNQSVLYRRNGIKGKEEMILDPNFLAADGTTSINLFQVSNDGKYAAYGISKGGSDWTEVKVIENASGRELAAFVNSKKLLYLDPTKPLVVRKTPSYMEGSGAGASISSPGPYDLHGNTYYNVSPLTNYSGDQAESYLREYNHYMLQILNIHEAIPGHYAQLVYANQSPSLIKSILGNGAMIEGWAVYSERMMLEEGYGNNEPELWLMYYKWHLRSVCNTILDYSVHVLDWPEKVAVKFLTDDAFQQPAEASGKWRRVKLTQVQLCSYFTGYSEIYDFREELKVKQGKDFDLKKFHEKFLSYGSAPVPYIRELMLEDLNLPK